MAESALPGMLQQDEADHGIRSAAYSSSGGSNEEPDPACQEWHRGGLAVPAKRSPRAHQDGTRSAMSGRTNPTGTWSVSYFGEKSVPVGCAFFTPTRRWEQVGDAEPFGPSIASIEAGLRSEHSCCTDDGTPSELYKLGKTLGTGQFGTVTEVEDDVGRVYALKAIKLVHVKDAQRFTAELCIHKRMNHPNIVRLHRYFKSADCYYIVMDHCIGGNLMEVVKDNIVLDFFSVKAVRKGLPAPAIAPFIYQMLSAIRYMHCFKMAHRDIKPENFMLVDKVTDPEGYGWPPLKLIDFGLARTFEEGGRMMSRVGTPRYAAPEVMASRAGYDEKCDVWSIGATAYVIAAGAFPFNGETDDQVLAAVASQEAPFDTPDWARHPKALRDLVKTMMSRNPAERPAPRALIENAWLVRNGAPSRPARRPAQKDAGACCAIS